ncbi:MAG: histidine kinase [Bacteroidota bacterium]
MRNTVTQDNTEKPRRKMGLTSSLLVLSLCNFYCWSQTASYQSELERLSNIEELTYATIDSVLSPFKADTIALNELITIGQRSSFSRGLCYLLNQKGVYYLQNNQNRRALHAHKKALKVAVPIHNPAFEMYTRFMLAEVYRKTNAVKAALDLNQSGLDIARTVPNLSTHAVAYRNKALFEVGQLYRSLDQYNLAILQFEEALKLEKAANNNFGQLRNLYYIGVCFEEKEEFQKGKEHFSEAIDLSTALGEPYFIVLSKNSLAGLYLKEKQTEKAFDLLESAQEIALKTADKSLLCAVQFNYGWALLQKGDYAQAKNYLDSGLQVANKEHYNDLLIRGKKLLGQLATQVGDHQEALKYFKEATKLEQKQNSEIADRYIGDLLLHYETAKKDNQMAYLANENELVKLRLRRNRTTILVGALVLGLIGTVLFIMYRQSQSNHEKRVIGLEQNMLRSQMNPHFLFNSLNSIKLYIINNDRKNAVHYLNKFSKLVRRILEGSTLKETSLAEELETVSLYLNIERIRFSEGIQYSISVEDDVDPEQIKIPSLLLQPFLENAIWHGLSSKEGPKNIWLDVRRKNSIHLLISIVDNGVGRQVSENIKKNRMIQRKSLGINITKERLANFVKDYKYGFDLKIIDLFDDNGQAKGTKVVLEIPMI